MTWSVEGRARLELAFQAAAAKGITVLCAAGDGGATCGDSGGGFHVIYPASSPWVIACGGTRVQSSNGQITSEVAWNDSGAATGGGVSEVFPQPDWQSGVNIPMGKDGRRGRGIPDVAANASPKSGYRVYVQGREMVVGGTTAVAPLWAGLIALLNQGIGRNLGYMNPLLYRVIGPTNVLRDIVTGNNGIEQLKGYQAQAGWDACTGWGSPDGKKLLEALKAQGSRAAQS